MRLLQSPGWSWLVIGATVAVSTGKTTAQDWGFPANFNNFDNFQAPSTSHQTIQGRELQVVNEPDQIEGRQAEVGFKTPGFNIPFENDLSFSEFGGSPFGDTPATFRQFLTGVGGAARSVDPSEFSERETPRFQIPTLGRNLVEVPTYKREIDARQLDRFEREFVRPQPVYVHPKRNNYQVTTAAVPPAATESYERRPRPDLDPVRRVYNNRQPVYKPVYKPELRQATSSPKVHRHTTNKGDEKNTIRPFGEDDFDLGFDEQRFEIQKEVVEEQTPSSYQKPPSSYQNPSSTTEKDGEQNYGSSKRAHNKYNTHNSNEAAAAAASGSGSSHMQDNAYNKYNTDNLHHQDEADSAGSDDYPRAREETDNPFIVESFSSDAFMKNDLMKMKMKPYVHLGTGSDQSGSAAPSRTNQPSAAGPSFFDTQTGSSGSFFDSGPPSQTANRHFNDESSPMDTFFRSKNDEIAAYFDSKPAKEKQPKNKGSFKPPTLIERFNTPVVEPSIPYSPPELNTSKKTAAKPSRPAAPALVSRNPHPSHQQGGLQSTPKSSNYYTTEKMVKPARVNYQANQRPNYPPPPQQQQVPQLSKQALKIDASKKPTKVSATKKPYLPPQKYEKKNFRAPLKAPPKSSSPHPVIRIKRPEGKQQQGIPEYRTLEQPAAAQQQRHQPLQHHSNYHSSAMMRPSQEYDAPPQQPGQLQIVEVQNGKQLYDNSQEIITLSPEVKRFSASGGKQSFNVKVKASFSPSSDDRLGPASSTKVGKRNGRVTPLSRRRSRNAPRGQQNPHIRRKKILKY